MLATTFCLQFDAWLAKRQAQKEWNRFGLINGLMRVDARSPCAGASRLSWRCCFHVVVLLLLSRRGRGSFEHGAVGLSWLGSYLVPNAQHQQLQQLQRRSSNSSSSSCTNQQQHINNSQHLDFINSNTRHDAQEDLLQSPHQCLRC